jgi:hypothetical protein
MHFYLDALLLRLCRGVSLLRLGMKMRQYLDQMCAQPDAFEVMSYPKTLLLRLSMKVRHYLDWTKYGSKYCHTFILSLSNDTPLNATILRKIEVKSPSLGVITSKHYKMASAQRPCPKVRLSLSKSASQYWHRTIFRLQKARQMLWLLSQIGRFFSKLLVTLVRDLAYYENS